MLRASLLRLPVIITFLNSAAVGIVLALLNYYYYAVPDVNTHASQFPSSSLLESNASSRIASQLWHSHNLNDSQAEFLKKTIRVLCFVVIKKPSFLGRMLYDESQRDTLTAVRSIVDTWGKRCSQIIMFGDVPDIQVDSIPFLAVRNDDADSWKAFAQVLTQVSTLFNMKFDWLIKVDMSTFVIMENLCYFVSSLAPSIPFYFGHTTSSAWSLSSYNSADAGILLSRGALLQLQRALANRVCTRDGISSSDVELGKCLAKISIYPRDTRDAFGHARFLPLDPKEHLLSKRSTWFDSVKSKYAIKQVVIGTVACS